ncbi:MAG: SulP family inorganic anion transporter, partial [Cyclobacteriaceae bacterium]
MVTVVAILLTDLLLGIAAGMVAGGFFALYHSYRNSHHMKEEITDENGVKVYHLILAEEVSFFNKASVIKEFDRIPPKSKVIIDCTNSKSISYDVIEVIKNFEENAKMKEITVEKINFIEPVY